MLHISNKDQCVLSEQTMHLHHIGLVCGITVRTDPYKRLRHVLFSEISFTVSLSRPREFIGV